MGFASGSISFRRYRLSGKCPKKLTPAMVEQMQEHAFGTSGSLSGDGTQCGWIAPTHLFDTKIEAERITFGDFVHLHMRLDQLSPPPALVRSYRRQEEEAALAQSGQPFLSKRQRRDAKEAAEARADAEARKGAFRRIAAHGILLDLAHRTAYSSSMGQAVHDKLCALFSQTFDLSLTPLNASELASEVCDPAGRHRSLEDAVPMHLVDPPDGQSSGSPMDPGDRSFLGREFLTWLWHQVDAGDGTVPIAPGQAVPLPDDAAVLIERMMHLDCDFQITGRDMIFNDSPSTSKEARAALRTGKQPTKMALVLACGGEQYGLVLDGPKWQIGSLKLPDSDEPDPQARLEERCLQVVRCSAVLDGLFASYLGQRFGGEFGKVAGRLRGWALTGTKAPVAVEVNGAEAGQLRIAR